MAKDPAFLFYDGDAARDVSHMNRLERGCYFDFIQAQKKFGPLNLPAIQKILGKDFETCWPALSMCLTSEKDTFYISWLKESIEKRSKYTESRRQSRLKSDEDNVKIYLIRDLDTGYYKLGSSVNPARRFAEMCNQKNPAITVGDRNYELFWASGVVRRIEETKLHKEFSSKNVTGEWFKFNSDDIQSIIRRFDKTYVPRTVIENEIVIENAIEEKEKLKEYDDWTDLIIDGNDHFFQQMFMKEMIPPGPSIQHWIMDHRDLLNRYPKMRPPTQDAFRKSLIKHIRENYKKQIQSNGRQKQNSNLSHAEDLAADFARRHGSG